MKDKYIFKSFSDLTRMSFLGSTVSAILHPDDGVESSSYLVQMPANGIVEKSFHKIAKEIIYVISGSGFATLDLDSVVPLKKGDTVIIFPPTPHGFLAGDKGLEMISFLSSTVNSKTDFFHCAHENYSCPVVMSGKWEEG